MTPEERKARLVREWKRAGLLPACATSAVIEEMYRRKMEEAMTELGASAANGYARFVEENREVIDAGRKRMSDYGLEDVPELMSSALLTSMIRNSVTAQIPEFEKKATEAAEEMIQQTIDFSAKRTGKMLSRLEDFMRPDDTEISISATIEPLPPPEQRITMLDTPSGQQAVKNALSENIRLIKSIPEQYLDRVEKAIVEGMRKGLPMDLVARKIVDISGLSMRRCQLIVADQTRKFNAASTLEDMKRLGLKKFKWVHVGGSAEPRPYHLHELNGQIFDIDDPPVIDLRTGERGYPGQLPNCRCVIRPIIDI